MSREEITACMDNDGPWNIPSVRNAIIAIEDWIAKGYFPKNLEAGGDVMEDLFYNEQALILITGNWSVKDIERVVGNKFEVGIFPFPSGTPGMKASAVNFAGSGYMVNNQGKNKEAAIKYIDFVMAKPETAKIWYEVGRTIPPFKGDIPGLQLGRLNQTVRAGLNDPNIQNLAGINMWLPPTAFDLLSKAGQRIAIKRLNRDTFIEELNKAYATDRANKATRSTF
jgi:ABC-type glycerol-3-phosphate transport system substrate-binding protein